MPSHDKKKGGGYGKPPSHTRYRPGQSGNPEGRRRERVNLEKRIEQILNEKVTIGGRSVTWGEAIARGLIARAAQDTRAAQFVLGLVGRDQTSSSDREQADNEDEAILENYVRSQMVPKAKEK